jgi:hypothetical protein
MALVQIWIDEWSNLSEIGVEGVETHMAGKNLKSSGKSRFRHIQTIYQGDTSLYFRGSINE